MRHLLQHPRNPVKGVKGGSKTTREKLKITGRMSLGTAANVIFPKNMDIRLCGKKVGRITSMTMKIEEKGKDVYYEWEGIIDDEKAYLEITRGKHHLFSFGTNEPEPAKRMS
jgi:hypothetical protein